MSKDENIEEMVRTVEFEDWIKMRERDREDIKGMTKATLSLLYSMLMLSEVMLEISGMLRPSLFLLVYPGILFLGGIGFVNFYFKKEVK